MLSAIFETVGIITCGILLCGIVLSLFGWADIKIKVK